MLDFWAGALDVDVEGPWIWLDSAPVWTGTSTGTAHRYAHFVGAAPNGGATKNCLRVLASGEWSDSDCTTSLGYVCKR